MTNVYILEDKTVCQLSLSKKYNSTDILFVQFEGVGEPELIQCCIHNSLFIAET